MHFLRLAAFTALSPLALADSTPASPDSSELIARQIPAPQINVYCISVEAKAYPDVFNSTFEDVCHSLSDYAFSKGEKVTNETCIDDICITTLLVSKCGPQGSSGLLSYESCLSLFTLPFTTKDGLSRCTSGGYVGSPVPGACWSALSIVTPRSSTERLPALPEKAWVSGAVESPVKRQAPTGVTACVGNDWGYEVSYDDFFNHASNFCTVMVDKDITLATGESYWSDHAYCNDENCLNFYMHFYCAAPGGGPAHVNVTYDGCFLYVLWPWWGPDKVSEHGYCAATQGDVIKGGWTTDRYPDACWNFTTLVLPPLSARVELPEPDDFVTMTNKVDPPSPDLLKRQAQDAGLECSHEAFHDTFDVFCQLYEYCPFLNDEPFNLTQHFDVLGRDVTLSVSHSGACLTGGKTGHDTCVSALEEALESVCKGGDMGGEEIVQADQCWGFSIELEPNDQQS